MQSFDWLQVTWPGCLPQPAAVCLAVGFAHSQASLGVIQLATFNLVNLGAFLETNLTAVTWLD